MSLNYKPENIPLAKALRKQATPQEDRLWYCFLQDYAIRYQRQKCIDSYIADFYCHRAKIVIEIDGAQHYDAEGKQYDALRTERLEQYGLTVIRITNRQIDRNFSAVCAYIDKVTKSAISSAK